MVKTVVIYKSKTGYAKKYAEWLAEELSADIFELSKVKIDVLTNYDNVIYGGSLHAVGIIGISFITKNIDKLKGKKVVVYATGASPSSDNVICEVMTNNIPPDQQELIKFFYLRGGFSYDKLPLTDKVLMALLKWKIKKKKKQGKPLTRDEKGMLAAFDNPMDFTKKVYIDDIVNYICS